MNFTKYMILCVILLSAVLLRGNEVIFEFSGGKANGPDWPAEKIGWTAKTAENGLDVTFAKWEKGRYEYPAVNVERRVMKKADWSKFGNIVVRVFNPKPELSPLLDLFFWSGEKRISFRQRIRAGIATDFAVRLEEVAKTIPLDRIDRIQICCPKPWKETTLRFEKISLSGKPAESGSARLAAEHSLLQEAKSGLPGWRTTGECNMQFDPRQAMLIHFDRCREGADKWPGVFVTPDGAGTLLDGDFSTKTHLLVEYDCIRSDTPFHTSLGLSFRDADGRRNFWQGLPYSETRCALLLPFYEQGINLADIRELSVGTEMPQTAETFRIHRLDLLFKPEIVVREPIRNLEKLIARADIPEVKQAAEKQLDDLKTHWAAVSGASASKSAIRDFFAAAEQANKAFCELSRRQSVEAVRRSTANRAFGLGLADSMEKVFLTGGATRLVPAKELTLELAANETESAQLAVVSFDSPVNDVKVEPSKLTGPGGAELRLDAGLVGHAKTVQPGYRVDYVGYYPDFVMDDVKTADLAANETTAFWLRCHAPAGTPPGIYRGSVTVSDRMKNTLSVPVTVRVFDFELPAGAPLPLSNETQADFVGIAYQDKDRASWLKHLDMLFDKMGEYRVAPDFLYGGPNPDAKNDWRYPALSKADKAGNVKAFCILNATLPRNIVNPDSPEVEKLLDRARNHMTLWIPAAKSNGIYGKAYLYGFDEAEAGAVMGKVFGELKRLYPDIPVMTTAGIKSADNPYVKSVDIWVPTAATYRRNPELVKALRQQGKQVWWYVCNYPRPPEAGLLLELPGTSPRLLTGMMTHKYKPEGFLYYSMIRWLKKNFVVESKTPRTEWNPATYQTDNGDGNLFVPGRECVYPTLRMENYRDGIEDHWYYVMLEKLVARAKEQGVAIPSELKKDIESVLTVPSSIVEDTAVYTDDPAPIREERRKLARCIEKLQALVEKK